MTDYFIPVIIAFIFLTAIIKKVDVFKVFTDGAKDGLKTAISILPVLVGLISIIRMLNASGGLNYLCNILSPFFSLFGLPKDLIPLALLRPISGGGALSLLEQVFKVHPPDSKVGLIASVLVASSETTFYTLAVYFGAVGISKTRYAIPAAVLGDFIGMIMSVLSVNLICK